MLSQTCTDGRTSPIRVYWTSPAAEIAQRSGVNP
jgi:hypothetical protein